MTPVRRIRRIQRWLSKQSKFHSYEFACKRLFKHQHICTGPLCRYDTWFRYEQRQERAELLIRSELDWLCREALLSLEGEK